MVVINSTKNDQISWAKGFLSFFTQMNAWRFNRPKKSKVKYLPSHWILILLFFKNFRYRRNIKHPFEKLSRQKSSIKKKQSFEFYFLKEKREKKLKFIFVIKTKRFFGKLFDVTPKIIINFSVYLKGNFMRCNGRSKNFVSSLKERKENTKTTLWSFRLTKFFSFA